MHGQQNVKTTKTLLWLTTARMLITQWDEFHKKIAAIVSHETHKFISLTRTELWEQTCVDIGTLPKP